MKGRFRALVADDSGDGLKATLRDLTAADLPDYGLLVEISHSTLNYKDALAVTGKGKICRSLPMVCGIDLAGTVLESRSDRFREGDAVVVNGFGLSERHWGGYSEYQRVDPDWAVRLPAAFNPEQAMGIGTAGYTAMLCVDALERHGLKPEDGQILVTGASGGVGSVAVMLLARLGYDVTAATGRAATNAGFLTGLGARHIIEREELARQAKALESERWAGAVDCVGGEVLSTALAQVRYGGMVAACGLAGSASLHTTVMPFILRGVTLAGIDSVMAPLAARERAWRRLAELVDLELLTTIYSVEPLSRLPGLAEGLLAGRVRGRIVVDVRG